MTYPQEISTQHRFSLARLKLFCKPDFTAKEFLELRAVRKSPSELERIGGGLRTKTETRKFVGNGKSMWVLRNKYEQAV